MSLPQQLQSLLDKANADNQLIKKEFSKLKSKKPKDLDDQFHMRHDSVFRKIDCLECANCCKTMTPTYTVRDLKRISKHFGMTVTAFQKKWLRREKGGDRDWMNKSTPCQFLNTKDNKCSIYAIRPADCAGFPHLAKDFQDYVHIHHQNVDSCPATFALVEKMMADFQ